MAEEFALNQFGRDGRAVHLNVRGGGAVALGVQTAGHQLLAGAVGPLDQHARRRRRHFRDYIPDMLHRSRLPYHPRSAEDLFLQHLVLGGEGRLVSGVLDGDKDSVQIQRFLDEIESAFLDAVHGSADIGVAGDHHYRAVHFLFRKFGKHFRAVHNGHLDIAENHVVVRGCRGLEALGAVFRNLNFVAFVRKNLAQRVAYCALVVYNQYFHCCAAFCAANSRSWSAAALSTLTERFSTKPAPRYLVRTSSSAASASGVPCWRMVPS